jgi:uncharacterized RDD family membrane protein YckC
VNAWPAPEFHSPVPSPAEYRFAGMGRRVGAWILDSLLSGLISAIAFVFAIVTGAVGFNQQALDQLKQVQSGAPDPFADVTAPLFIVHTGPLIAAVVLLIAISVVYFAGSWMLFGGTPCQRALGLRVVDVADGEKLSIDAAVIRWLLVSGIAGILSGVLAVVLLNWMATTPTNQWLSVGAYGSTTTTLSFGGAGGLSNVISWGSTLWSIVLLISAGINPTHRAIHDRLSGSIVIGRVQVVPAGWGGYGTPSQAWPGYQPQGPGYPAPNPQAPQWQQTPQWPQGSQPQSWPGYQPQDGQPTPLPPAGPVVEPPKDTEPGR